MKTTAALIAAVLLAGCTIANWPGAAGSFGYGYPRFGYGYPVYGYPRYGYGYPAYGWNGSGWGGYSYGYNYGYNNARREDWQRWQAYQYGLSQAQGQGQGSQPSRVPQSLPYGITRNLDGKYNVPGYGNFTEGQIQNWARKRRR